MCNQNRHIEEEKMYPAVREKKKQYYFSTSVEKHGFPMAYIWIIQKTAEDSLTQNL